MRGTTMIAPEHQGLRDVKVVERDRWEAIDRRSGAGASNCEERRGSHCRPMSSPRRGLRFSTRRSSFSVVMMCLLRCNSGCF